MKRYVTKAELLSLQTNERRKLAARKLEQQAAEDKQRYDEALLKRREKQRYATEMYQRSPLRKLSSSNSVRRPDSQISTSTVRSDSKVKNIQSKSNPRPHTVNVTVSPRKVHNSHHQYVFTPTLHEDGKEDGKNHVNLSRSRDLFIKTLQKHEERQLLLCKKQMRIVGEVNGTMEKAIANKVSKENCRSMSIDSLNEEYASDSSLPLTLVEPKKKHQVTSPSPQPGETKENLYHKFRPNSVIPELRDNIDVGTVTKNNQLIGSLYKHSISYHADDKDAFCLSRVKSPETIQKATNSKSTNETAIMDYNKQDITSVVFPDSSPTQYIPQASFPLFSKFAQSMNGKQSSHHAGPDKLDMPVSSEDKLYYVNSLSNITKPSNIPSSKLQSFQQAINAIDPNVPENNRSLQCSDTNSEIKNVAFVNKACVSRPMSFGKSEHAVYEQTDSNSIVHNATLSKTLPSAVPTVENRDFYDPCKRLPKTDASTSTTNVNKSRPCAYAALSGISQAEQGQDPWSTYPFDSTGAHSGITVNTDGQTCPELQSELYSTHVANDRSEMMIGNDAAVEKAREGSRVKPPSEILLQTPGISTSNLPSHIPVPAKRYPLRGILRKTDDIGNKFSQFKRLTSYPNNNSSELLTNNSLNNQSADTSSRAHDNSGFRLERTNSGRRVRFTGIDTSDERNVRYNSECEKDDSVHVSLWPDQQTTGATMAGKQVAKVSPQIRSSMTDSDISFTTDTEPSVQNANTQTDVGNKSKTNDKNNNQQIILTKPPTGLVNQAKSAPQFGVSNELLCQNAILGMNGKTYQEIYQTRKKKANQNPTKNVLGQEFKNKSIIVVNNLNPTVVTQQMKSQMDVPFKNGTEHLLMPSPSNAKIYQNISKNLIDPNIVYSDMPNSCQIIKADPNHGSNRVFSITDQSGRQVNIYPSDYSFNKVIQLDKTPTDEEINTLWSSVKTCLSRTYSEGDLYNTPYQPKENEEHPTSNPVNINHQNNLSNQAISCQQSDLVNNASVKYPNRSLKVKTPVLKVTMNDIHNNRVMSAGSRSNLLQRQQQTPSMLSAQKSSGSPQKHPVTQNSRREAWSNDVSESMAAFLTAEEMALQGATESMIERGMDEARYTHQACYNPNSPQGPSTLSLEEQRLWESISRLDHQLKCLYHHKHIHRAASYCFCLEWQMSPGTLD